MRSFNAWILEKIKNYLEGREGCLIYTSEYTKEEARTLVQDSLGFVYEVSIKTIGRVSGPANEGRTKTVRILERVK